MISELILQEEITILNTHAPNNMASKCMRQKGTKLRREKDKPDMLAEDLNISLSVSDRPRGQEAVRKRET